MLYHAGTNKFYDTDKIAYNDLPEPTVIVDRDIYKELLRQKSLGKVIVPDEDGYPTLSDPPLPVVNETLVNEERERRIQGGVTVDLTGYGPVSLQGRPNDQINLMGLFNGATLMVQQGDATTLTTFRDADNVDHDLTPIQIIEMWSKGMSFVSSVIRASWVVKDLDPIPLDYTDDKYWP